MRWEHFNVWQKCKMNYHYYKRKKESLWKIERERLKWHLAHKSIIGNNNWLTAYDIHMYIYYTGQLMTVFSNNYINYIFFYLWKILFFGPLENSNLFNLHGKITGPQHTYTNFQKLSKRILDPLLLINSDYLLMDLLTIKNRPWVKDSSINCTSNHKIVTKSDLFYNVSLFDWCTLEHSERCLTQCKSVSCGEPRRIANHDQKCPILSHLGERYAESGPWPETNVIEVIMSRVATSPPTLTAMYYCFSIVLGLFNIQFKNPPQCHFLNSWWLLTPMECDLFFLAFF